MRASLIIGIILSILLTAFALLNKASVPVNYFFGKIELPLSLLLMITLASGVLIMFLFNIPSWWKNRKEKASLKKEITLLKSQLEQPKPPIQKEDIQPTDEFINDVEKE